jgi:DNA-binding XRE family transcriptional regulator
MTPSRLTDYAALHAARLRAFATPDGPATPATPGVVEAEGGPPLPGTLAKFELMKARVAEGLTPHQPGDVICDPCRVVDASNGRNGHRKSMKKRKVLAVPALDDRVVTLGTTSGTEKRRLVYQIAPPHRLAARLVELRRARKLSLGAVSLETGVSKTALIRLERGARRHPTLATVMLLAHFYRVSIDSLVGFPAQSARPG